jgi:hypothetical protein
MAAKELTRKEKKQETKSPKTLEIEACQKFIEYRLACEYIINVRDLLQELKRSRKFSIDKNMTMETFINNLLFNELPDRKIVLFQYQGEVLICAADDFGDVWQKAKEEEQRHVP